MQVRVPTKRKNNKSASYWFLTKWKKTICSVVYSFWKLWHDYHLLPSRDDSIVLGSGHEYSKKQQQNKQLPTRLVEKRNHEKVSISLSSKILVIPTQLARDWVYLFLSVLNHGRICAPNYVGSVFVWRVGKKNERRIRTRRARAIHHDANTQCAGDNIS